MDEVPSIKTDCVTEFSFWGKSVLESTCVGRFKWCNVHIHFNFPFEYYFMIRKWYGVFAIFAVSATLEFAIPGPP